jgi:MFS family permease
MFAVGGVCFIIFILIELKWARLPMFPLAMFKKPSVAAMMAQSFLVGTIYYTYIYFLPLYFQNVRGYSPLLSAALQLPLVVVQSTVSSLAGYYISCVNRYLEVIWFGFGIWLLGSGLLIMANDTIHIGLISFFLMVVGCGTGCTFQPTLVALQAHCPKNQRAVVTSNRNFLRQGGAAVGLAVSSAIMANVLKTSFPKRLESLAQDSFAAPNLSGYSLEDQAVIRNAYSHASRAVFIFCTPLVGVCFVLSVFIKDHGLVRKEERDEEKKAEEPESQLKSSTADRKLISSNPEVDMQDRSDLGERASLDSQGDHSKAASLCSEKGVDTKVRET